jgi:hypothetical protein
VHAVLIGDGADAFDEHQVLAVVVLVRHGSCARTEVHGQGTQARQRTGKFLHPYVVRVVEQRPELVGYRASACARRRAELVHGMLRSLS